MGAASSAPHEDDVKVAGDPPRTGVPSGDTLGFEAVPAEPLRTGPSAGEPRDEIAAGPRAPRAAGRRGRARRVGDRRGRDQRGRDRHSGEQPGGDRHTGDRQGGDRQGGGAKRNGMRIAAIAAGAAVVVGGGAVAAFALTGGSGDDGTQTVKPTKQLADAAPKVDPKVLEEQRRQLAMERASRATREDGGKGPSLHPKGKPIPTKKPEPPKKSGSSGGGSGAPAGDPVPKGEAQQIAKRLLPSFGFSGDGQFGCLVKLWDRESGWNSHAENPSSGAYGIPQALPGSKMASAGPDWRNSATTQIKWGLGYIKDRYKTPCGAWSHFQSAGSY